MGMYSNLSLGKDRDLKQEYQSLLTDNIDLREYRIEQEAR
jgi:hypothetical protein